MELRISERFSNEEIEMAKTTYLKEVGRKGARPTNDLIKISLEWLSPQRRVKIPQVRSYGLKHIIEKWAGVYVCKDDVEVASILLGINRNRGSIGVSQKYVFPNPARLNHFKDVEPVGPQDWEEGVPYCNGRYIFIEGQRGLAVPISRYKVFRELQRTSREPRNISELVATGLQGVFP